MTTFPRVKRQAPLRRRVEMSRPQVRRGLGRRLSAGVAMAGLLAVALVALPAAPAAHAAPGDPFDPLIPAVFINQSAEFGGNTQLFRVTTSDVGAITFAAEGPRAGLNYNSLAFNPADNFMYATVLNPGLDSNSVAVPEFALVRVGQEGFVTQVGTATYPRSNTGFFHDGLFWTGTTRNGFLTAIDVTTGEVARTLTLPESPTVIDLVYADGWIWGAESETGNLVRFDVTTGEFTRLPLILREGGFFGGAWQFGNGNLGFIENSSGNVYQVRVTDPSSDSPTLALVAEGVGPTTQENDGTAILGTPTDLQLLKTAAVVGSTVTYTLRVTNNGPGLSSGFVVTDTVPAPLTDVTSSFPGCSTSGSTVTCRSGVLAAGESRDITIQATSPSPSECVVNTARVDGNELDPVASNNSGSNTCAPELAATGTDPVVGVLIASGFGVLLLGLYLMLLRRRADA